jgi:hypothetical protein
MVNAPDRAPSYKYYALHVPAVHEIHVQYKYSSCLPCDRLSKYALFDVDTYCVAVTYIANSQTMIERIFLEPSLEISAAREGHVRLNWSTAQLPVEHHTLLVLVSVIVVPTPVYNLRS